MTKPRLDIIIKSPSGGAWNNQRRVAQIWAELGHEVRFIFVWSSEKPSIDGMTCKPLLGAKKQGRLLKFMSLITSLLTWFYSSDRADILIVKGVPLGVPITLLNFICFWRRSKIILIADMHTSGHLDHVHHLQATRSWLFKLVSKITHSRKLYRWMMRHVDHVIGNNHHIANDFVENFGLDKGKAHAIPSMMNDHFFKTKLITERPDDKILFVGRMTDQKNIEHLLKAFQIVLTNAPHLRLLIAGYGPLKDHYQNLARTMDINDNIDFLGNQSDINMLQNQCRCLVLTSHYEGVPQVMIEAMANGMPVIAYDHLSGPLESIGGGVNGELVASGDIHAMADAIERSSHYPWKPTDIRESIMDFHPDEAKKHYIAFAENHLN